MKGYETKLWQYKALICSFMSHNCASDKYWVDWDGDRVVVLSTPIKVVGRKK